MHAHCSFGHRLALGDIDYDFDPGKMYALAGANGSGKSTLLLTLAGEIEPVAGQVDYGDDQRVVRVGDPVFYPDLTVREHLALLAADVDEVADRWVLNDLLDAPPAWLSSGQRQRVFLASQLDLPADVLLIDEPERHLDNAWVEFLVAELKEHARDAAVIVATHSQTVLAACDEVINL